ncbi:MAG: YigZ family protein [Candidatus Spyradocola sp.]|nr:YigZ family protein [Candidatus Spyradocola sp.]
MQQTAYKTVAQSGSSQFIINKSRFIGYAAPCTTEEEALAFLASIREKHKDASHNCYAYVIGRNAGIARYSDDGEPSGTAGMPIIEVIKARGVVDVCVVVTRYFGGILLGAGGLVRAYAQGSKVALDAARVVVMHPTCRYAFDVDYSFVGKLDHWLLSQPVLVNEREFGVQVTYDLSVKKEDADGFLKGLTQLSQGRLEPVLLEESFSPWQETADTGK